MTLGMFVNKVLPDRGKKRIQLWEMADLRLFSRTFITEFIELYKSYPCLWQVNSKEYTDRTKRKSAYDALVRKYREVDKSASKDEVKRKIYGLRSSYRRELIKLKKSIRSGVTLEDVYKPSLWYFYLFDFLNDQETMTKEPTSTTDECQDEAKEEEIEYDAECDLIEHYTEDLVVDEDHHELDDVSSETDNDDDDDDAIDPINCDTLSEYTSVSCRSSTAPSTSRTHFTTRKRKITSEMAANQKEDQFRVELVPEQAKEQNNQPTAPAGHSSPQEDQFDVYGKLIAHKLRSFDKLQVTFSQRLINEILYEAEMGFLTRNCKVVDMGAHAQDE